MVNKKVWKNESDTFPDYLTDASFYGSDDSYGWISGMSDSFLRDAQYLLAPEELRNIDKDVRRVIFRSSVLQKIVPTVQIARGKTEHRVSIAQEPSAPVFSKDFLVESADKVAKSESIFYLTGISKDYIISMVDIDASRNSDYHRDKIDAIHLREMTALISDYKERVLMRGSDIANANPGAINPNATGIINASGINTYTKQDLGSAGDGQISVDLAMKELIIDNFQPPYAWIVSPYIVSQLALNRNATTSISDLDFCREMKDHHGNKVLSDIFISDHMETAVDVGTNSASCFIAPKTNAGEDTIQIVESYPQWHYPLTTNKLAIQGKCLWMGGVAVIRPKAICYENAINVSA